MKMASDNEQKLDELTRKLGVQEDELKRAIERAELAEGKLRDVEQELEAIGENMKQLEISAEKAQEREEKLTRECLIFKQIFSLCNSPFTVFAPCHICISQPDVQSETKPEELNIEHRTGCPFIFW